MTILPGISTVTTSIDIYKLIMFWLSKRSQNFTAIKTFSDEESLDIRRR